MTTVDHGGLNGLSHLPKRRTMIKDRVGCVKSAICDLPPSEHTYGLKLPPDLEGSAAIISNWVTANPSLHKENGKKIVYGNILALKNGCITAKSMRQYSLAHPNIRLKESVDDGSKPVDSSHEGPFGVKTISADETMESIIQGRYINYKHDDADYPDVSSIKKPGAMPKPRSTIAAKLMLKTRKEKDVRFHTISHMSFINNPIFTGTRRKI